MENIIRSYFFQVSSFLSCQDFKFLEYCLQLMHLIFSEFLVLQCSLNFLDFNQNISFTFESW